MRRWTPGLTIFGAVALAACGGAGAGDDAAESPAPAPAATPATPAATLPAGSPETTAASVWAHLNAASYRDNWALWPGKGERYPGGEPHGSTLTTYVNGIAAGALADRASEMPPGAIIVKENYMPSGELAAITTMFKVPGYNPSAGDWHWVKFLPDGSVDGDGAMEGQVPGCIQCHTGSANNDYIVTGPLANGGS